MRHLAAFILGLLLLSQGAAALTFVSDAQSVIDTPIDDDVVASGGSVTINAPIRSLTAAGGTVTVNAPVDRDVVVIGGTVAINGDVGGKVLAFGGDVQMNGGAFNALLSGGTVGIGSDAVIRRDAAISGGSVFHAGTVERNLTVTASTFDNTGTAGNVTYEEARQGEAILATLSIFQVLIAVGFLILGILVINFFPEQFSLVVRQIELDPILRTIVGFFGAIVSAIIIGIVAITIIGLPVAIFAGVFFIAALMLSTLFVAYVLGYAVISRSDLKIGVIGIFTLGFVVLQVLYLIPILGALIQIIAVSLGYGALLYALRNAWRAMRGGRTP
jgi:hypothetical protein